MTQYDPNAILMGGGSGRAWKFDEPGTTFTGTISEPPEARQEREYDRDNPGGGAPKFFPSGDPIMGVVVRLNTDARDDGDDDGRRTFYVEGRYIKEAVRDAVRKAGATGLEVGGKLTVTFTHREDPMDKRSRKYWEVVYVPAGSAALMADEPKAAPAPTPAAQPAPAPEASGSPQFSAEQLAALKAAGVSLPGITA